MKTSFAVEVAVEITAPSWHRLGRDLHPLVRRSVEAALVVAPDAVAIQNRKRRKASIAVLLAGKQKLRSLNRSFCHQDKTTDVLAFPADPTVSALAQDSEALALGDLAIGWEPCLASAVAFSATPRQQLQHLVVHGTLHLLGFDHKTDSQSRRMRRLESAALESLGVPDPWREQGKAQSKAGSKTGERTGGKPRNKAGGKAQNRTGNRAQNKVGGKPRGKPQDMPRGRTGRKKAYLPAAKSAA